MVEHGLRRHGVTVMALVAVLILAALASLAFGSRPVSAAELVAVVRGEGDAMVRSVMASRVPRTGVGIVVGALLGVAGLLMQSLTRNPLADPGLLGVNAGAAAAVVVTAALVAPGAAVVAALPGALLAMALVTALSWGREGMVPVRVVLAGAAVTAALMALIQGITLSNPKAFDSYRLWAVGSLSGARLDPASLAVGLAGLVGAALLTQRLNALALGDDTAASLGQQPTRSRLLGLAAAALMCAAATTMIGPVSFLGLAAPHIARTLVGADHRWQVLAVALLGPVLLLAADVLGRVLVRPEELQVGVVVAFAGAPVMLALVRAGKLR